MTPAPPCGVTERAWPRGARPSPVPRPRAGPGRSPPPQTSEAPPETRPRPPAATGLSPAPPAPRPAPISVRGVPMSRAAYGAPRAMVTGGMGPRGPIPCPNPGGGQIPRRDGSPGAAVVRTGRPAVHGSPGPLGAGAPPNRHAGRAVTGDLVRLAVCPHGDSPAPDVVSGRRRPAEALQSAAWALACAWAVGAREGGGALVVAGVLTMVVSASSAAPGPELVRAGGGERGAGAPGRSYSPALRCRALSSATTCAPVGVREVTGGASEDGTCPGGDPGRAGPARARGA